jgi:glycosyltransferase involved in cell wall biosynthesis
VKLAFVVQRYGADIAGGSEAHCRDLAQRLATRHDATVLTTCAGDYVSWANAYAPGTSADGSVRVIRFAVRRQRRLGRFAEISDEVFDGGAAPELEEQWFRENGPDAPGLLEHLAARGSEYDLVLFWTYRYATSFFGLPLVADRAVLVPTAEEDPAIHLQTLERFFQQPAGYLFLTPEEASLVRMRAGRLPQPSAIVGTGLDPAPAPDPSLLVRAAGVPSSYLLYLGRVDRNKGCQTLFDYFLEYAASRPSIHLVLAGPAKMPIPAHPQVTALGYVSEDMRDALLAGAQALVVPSPYESLSIVLLQAWNHGVPAIVNAECRVLEGQVRRANGGLAYRSAADFGEALDCFAADAKSRAIFGRQGLAYVEREYRWPTVMARVEHLLETVAAARRPEFPAASC